MIHSNKPIFFQIHRSPFLPRSISVKIQWWEWPGCVSSENSSIETRGEL